MFATGEGRTQVHGADGASGVYVWGMNVGGVCRVVYVEFCIVDGVVELEGLYMVMYVGSMWWFDGGYNIILCCGTCFSVYEVICGFLYRCM